MEENEKTNILSQQEESGELEELKLKELRRWNMAPGDIHWKKSNGKLIKLYGAGEYVDKKKMEVFFEKKLNIVYQALGNYEQRQQLELALQRYLHAEVEAQRLKHRRQLLGLIKSLYWVPSESSLIDLVLVFDKFLNKWPKHDPEFLKGSPDVHKRNALIGTLNALGGIILSYNDVHYLQDLYNVVFLIDSSYKETMTPQIYDLIDTERVGDKAFLKSFEHLDVRHKKAFEEHAQKDFEYAMENYRDLFSYPSTLLFLKRHHEKTSGEGMPVGVTQEEVSDIELWGLLINRIVQHESFQYKNGDGESALFKTLNLSLRDDSKNKDYIARRVSMLVNGVMEYLTPVRNVA